MIDFSKLRLIATSDAIEQSLEYYWRRVCRDYSQRFHTPLHVVEGDLSPAYVFRHVVEEQYDRIMDEENGEERMMKIAQSLLGIDDGEEQLLAEQVKMWEKEEEDRLKKQESRKKAGKKFKKKSAEPTIPEPEIAKKYDMGDPDKE
jgi:hypothetical protein